MSKMKKAEKTSKVLVRNPSVPVRPCKVASKTHGLKKVHFVDEKKPNPEEKENEESLLSPQFCTLLQVAEELKSLRNAPPGSSRSIPDVVRYRNLNFQPEEKIYQDLVGLEVPERDFTSEVRSQPSRFSLKKDPELDVSKYLKIPARPDYYFASSVEPGFKKQKPVFDGCSIFKKLEMWKHQME